MKFNGNKMISTLLILSPFFVHAQSCKVLALPEKYKIPSENLNTTKDNKSFGSEVWIVFSDSDNNQTYTTAGGHTEFKTISFMDEFYVVGETDDQLHVVKGKDSDLKLSTLELKSNIDYGWINKNRLLLWNHCLVTEKAGITKKAMVLNTNDGVPHGKNTAMLHFFNKPALTGESANNSQFFQIYYVYKKSEDGKSLLLGKTTIIGDKRNASSEIPGWAASNRLVFWDHRVAIEPNWFSDAVNERESKRVKATIFSDANEAVKYNTGKSQVKEKILWDEDTYGKRPEGKVMRFPLLNIDNRSNIIKCGVWDANFTESGEGIDLSLKSSIESKINFTVNHKRNINIVFVVDGSSGMLPYYHSLANAISISVGNLGQTKNNFRFGVVVYHYIAGGQSYTKKIALSSAYQEVVTWLNKEISTSENVNNKDNQTPVFLGLKDALQNADFPDSETNYLILIGNEGDQTNDENKLISRESLVKMMADKNINFISFQVSNKDGENYHKFIRQSKDLMLSSALKIWSNNESCFKQMASDLPPEIRNISKGEYVLAHSPITGKLVSCNTGKTISTTAFQELIISAILKSDVDANNTNGHLNELLTGDGFSMLLDENISPKQVDESFKPLIINILAQSGISRSQLSNLERSVYPLYSAGYTSRQPENLQYPVFQTVLFITRMELGGIISDMSRLLYKSTGADARRQIYTTWLRILEEHLGESFSNELTNKSMEEITEILFGLPTRSKLLDQISLEDILDPLRFPDDKLTSWMSEIDQKTRALRNIQNTDNYPYSFTSNDEIYYWIIQSNLP